MENLFKEFKPGTAAEWKAQLLQDLKGESPDQLTWENENGISIAPYYTSEDLQHTYEPAFTHADWQITGKAENTDATVVNQRLLRQLKQGATSVEVNYTGENYTTALKDISLPHINAVFFVARGKVTQLLDFLDKSYGLSNLNCSFFATDIQSENDGHDWLEKTSVLKSFTNLRAQSFNVLPFHNHGCVAQYEIALALSGLAAFLSRDAGSMHPSAFTVKLGVNSDYFVQIAKLRALRRLWELFKKEFKLTNDLYVIAETSVSNKSLGDSHNNLLRTTVEAMAAVLGGCNELVVNEFDVLFPGSSSLAERMAINQQLILKEESYFDKMADVACGSYFVESLTDALATQALATFKGFEKQGGYFVCLEKGVFEKEIRLQYEQEAARINDQKKLVIGVNKYRNEKDQPALDENLRRQLAALYPNNAVLNFELNKQS